MSEGAAEVQQQAPQAEAPPPQAAPQPPPIDAAALQQTIQQMQARLAQQDAIIQQAAQQATQRAQPQGDEEEYIDPTLAKQLTKREQAILARMHAQNERLDYIEFTGTVRELGLGEEERKAAEEIYQGWRRNNVVINGEPPSRQDALTFALGQRAKQGASKSRAERAAEEQRRLENAAGFVERSGRAQRASGLPDPEKMSRKERLEKYYPAVLDEEGF